MMRTQKHTGGFSYLEVLIAGAILSSVLVPLVAGFYQAAINLKSSEQRYKAALCAQNLIVDAKTALQTGGSISALAGSLSEDDKEFDYALQLCYMEDGAKTVGAYAATAEELPNLPEISVSGGSPEELWRARGSKRPCLIMVAVYDGSKQLCVMTVPAFEGGR